MFSPWVPREKVQSTYLSDNPCDEAVRFLESHPEYVDWCLVARNRAAMPLLEPRISRGDTEGLWRGLSCNSSAMDAIADHPEKTMWTYLSYNSHPRAVDMIAEFLETHTVTQENLYINWETPGIPCVFWYALCHNRSAGHILSQPKYKPFFDVHLWNSLCHNSAQEVVDMILDEYARDPDSSNLRWSSLCMNQHPAIVDLVRQNMDRADWHSISGNPAAIDLLESHPEKIDYEFLCENTAAEHLLKEAAMHPMRRQKLNYIFLARNPVIFQSPLARLYKNPLSCD